MKKPQWITILTGICLVTVIYLFGKTVPARKTPSVTKTEISASDYTIDSVLTIAKAKISPEQSNRLTALEHSISRGDVKDQQIGIYHQLAHFWGDTAAIFEPYAWYEAEAARLENSEKSLNFAARLFLENLQADELEQRRRWKALQAKDLFERALKINPANDSSRVGLGACFLFGGITSNPMEGILKIREVAEKDSTNVYAQIMLAKGSLISGQYDKAISRLETISRVEPDNVEVILMLADTNERMADKVKAIKWYQESLKYIKRQDARDAIEKRIEELGK